MSTVHEAGRAAFNAAYAALNAAQRQAVDTIDGPVAVIAGPGTGKTQVLTLRIANILLQTDTAPESILALTFTDSGAAAMRTRLRTYLGSEAYRVPIYTFHSFATQLIGRYPDAYPHIIGGQAATELERIAMIETILESGVVPKLRPKGNPTYYVTPLLRMMSVLKQENVTPERLQELMQMQRTALQAIPQYHEKGAHKGKVRGEYTKAAESIEKNEALLTVYRQYQALLRQAKRYDFDDMLIETVAALGTNEDMLRDLQETYQYLLADEHQDVNSVQNTILELLANFHERPNIFVVGDEKQAIYRFQGASMENFLYFTARFPDTVTISLTDNYRSGQVVLDAAHDLVAVEDEVLKELRVPLKAAAVSEAAVDVRTFAHQAIEEDWLVEAIEVELEAGTPPAEIAVIVRKNREVEALAARLRKAGIAVTASAEGDILTHPITLAVIELIEAVVDPYQERALFGVIQAVYSTLPAADVARVLQARRGTTPLIEIISDPAILKELGVQAIDDVLAIAAWLSAARAAQVVSPPHRVLEGLLTDSGLLEHILATDPLEGVRVVRRLYDEVESLVTHEGATTLRAVLQALSTRTAYHIPLQAPYIRTTSDAVQVMTAHKAKGLEFAVVFLPHLFDSNWNGGQNRTLFSLPLFKTVTDKVDVIEDERRLLYVAMTRAKTTLHLSYASESSAGKAQLPSRLVMDIAPELLTVCDTAAAAAQFDPVAALRPSPESAFPAIAVVKQHLQTRGFSATSLNNYLESPWNYFFKNVLRIPQPQALPLQYGTAIHNVLERVVRAYVVSPQAVAASDIQTWLRAELDRLPLSPSEAAQLHESALVALTSYLPHLYEQISIHSRTEHTLSVVLETGVPEVPELPLTGKLDRLDFSDSGDLLQVVDYKTGKPKSRNAIEGKTAGSNGAYKRQLVFYALLLELSGDPRYQGCRTGVLSFVEPERSGAIKEERFVITDDEIAALKTTLIDAVRDLVSGEFIERPCDPEASEYCSLAARWQVGEG